MIRLVAFDLDRTLVDSHRDIADATNAVIADVGGTHFSNRTAIGSVRNSMVTSMSHGRHGAVDRPDILGLLRDFGFDPDARTHQRVFFDVVDWVANVTEVDALVLHSGRDSVRMRSSSVGCRFAAVNTSTLRSSSSSRS